MRRRQVTHTPEAAGSPKLHGVSAPVQSRSEEAAGAIHLVLLLRVLCLGLTHEVVANNLPKEWKDELTSCEIPLREDATASSSNGRWANTHAVGRHVGVKELRHAESLKKRLCRLGPCVETKIVEVDIRARLVQAVLVVQQL